MRGLTAATLAVLYALGAAQAGRCQSEPDDNFIPAIKAIKRSVAPVMCVRAVQPQLRPMAQQSPPGTQQPDSNPQAAPQQLLPMIDGTAFFITRRGDFVTAAHVLDDFIGGGRLAGCAMNVWFSSAVDVAGNFSAQAFFVAVPQCVEDRSIDIARCRTIDDLSTAYGGRFSPDAVAFDVDRREDGTGVAVTGYPLFDTMPITARGHIGAYQPVGQASMAMVLDVAAWPDGGGSPVYDSRGKVVGAMVRAEGDIVPTLSTAIGSRAISAFLAARATPNK